MIIPKHSCIAILGCSRSGTSAVAGVLHHLGVNMGTKFWPANPNNPKGFFEDMEFLELHKRIVGDWLFPVIDFEPYREEYRRLIRKREANPLWGIKDPRLCYLFPFFLELLSPSTIVKAICTERDVEASARSIVRRDPSIELEKALDSCRNYVAAKENALRGFAGEILFVKFDELFNCTSELEKICRFVKQPPTPEARAFLSL